MEKMLIADDNRQITAVLTAYARKEGFEPVVAYDGEEALAAYRREAPAVILLDVMMPKLDGFEVCRQIREESAVPIIMITARGEDFEKIMGLDIGADDYIVKPFSGGEVMARVRAILRRLSRDGGARLQFFSYRGLTIDLDTYTTTVDGEAIPLTKRRQSCSGPLPPTGRRSFPGITCWTLSGVMTITVITAPSIPISGDCGPSWTSGTTPGGASRRSGVWVTVSR